MVPSCRLRLLLSMILLLLALSGAVARVTAQHLGPFDATAGRFYRGRARGAEFGQAPLGLAPVLTPASMATAAASPSSTQATGGPDRFGYVWDDTEPYSWVDATGGTETGLGGSTIFVGPVSLPFAFEYYENSYDEVYIAKFGFVTFDGAGLESPQGGLLDPRAPNDLVAPHMTSMLVDEDGYTGKVYYASGGVSPNRYFVVQWDGVRDELYPEDSAYTFEVVLLESGDILFQYADMDYSESGYVCAQAGIDDSRGLDGLVYYDDDICDPFGSAKAVRFSRPAPSARVFIPTLYQGAFASPGAISSFELPILNTGTLGNDTYDLLIASPWPVTLHGADGIQPLTDTDGDGTVDTGAVVQGQSTSVVVKVATPAQATAGSHNAAYVEVRSSLDTARSVTVSLQTAVPVPFAQAYSDSTDAAMSLYLARPKGSLATKVTPGGVNASGRVLAETPEGNFVSAWTAYRSLGGIGLQEIQYALLDACGLTTQGATYLTDHTAAGMVTLDQDVAVAVAPDGRAGFTWSRLVYNSSAGEFLHNIYFAVVSPAGEVIVPPTSITENTLWHGGGEGSYGVPEFDSPRIAATGDNRFVVAWARWHTEPAGLVDDIYYAVRDSAGDPVAPVTKLTDDTPGAWGYRAPTVTALTANRALLTWISAADSNDDIHYAVAASDGSLVKPATDLSIDETVVDWQNYDAVALSTGRIAVFWEAMEAYSMASVPLIRYAILDSTYSRVVAPTVLALHPANVDGVRSVSAAADDAGNAILTWVDNRYPADNLYYTVLDGAGEVVTAPMIYMTRRGEDSSLSVSSNGYSITGYSQAYARACRVWLPLSIRGDGVAMRGAR